MSAGDHANLVAVRAVSHVPRRGSGVRRWELTMATERRRPASRWLGALGALAAASLLLTACPAALAARAAVAAPAAPAAPAQGGPGRVAAAQRAICTAATKRYRRDAARMSREIRAVLLRQRSSVVALAAADGRTRITCGLRSRWHFHSASIVKVLILATLLHDLAVRHEHLTNRDVVLTTEMITESDNDAATALWDQDGIANLQHFLDLARMRHTVLGVAHWGLTEVTAQDEMTLLRLLAVHNRVLDRSSRGYALRLMADVIPSQRWGVPAGTPAGVKVHLKNGWLPDPELWVINSIGVFTQRHRVYRIVILTRDNPDMDYGVDTVQDLAEVINRGYNPGRKPAVAPSRPFPSWGIPDEPRPG